MTEILNPETVDYRDAMKRLNGSMLGPQLAAPIETYVTHLQRKINMLESRVRDLEAQKIDNLAIIDDLLDTKSDKG